MRIGAAGLIRTAAAGFVLLAMLVLSDTPAFACDERALPYAAAQADAWTPAAATIAVAAAPAIVAAAGPNDLCGAPSGHCACVCPCGGARCSGVHSAFVSPESVDFAAPS